MAYIKYKEVTKYFNFNKVLDKKNLPSYINEYVFEDETILVAYKTITDHGIFTTRKIVLFDSFSMFGRKKIIYTIPYKSISTASVLFDKTSAELNLYLDSGYPLRLKFKGMDGVDKLRLRLLYSCIIKVIENQKLKTEEIEKLVEDKISFDNM